MSVARKISRDLDNELAWIVRETVSALFRDVDTVKRVTICKAVGRATGQVLIERMGKGGDGLTLDEFEALAVDSLGGMDKAALEEGSDAISAHVAEACVAYAHCRDMGMKSPYRIARRFQDDYNPFGTEGGFCNPMKLKMMD